MTSAALNLDTALGPFLFSAACDHRPGEVSLDLRTFEPRLSLPAGMSVLRCRAVVLRVTSQVDIAGLRWSCESPPGVAGSGCSGERLDAQEWEAGSRLVVVGTEDEDALADRLGLPRQEPYRGWVSYSPCKLEVRIPWVPASPAFGLHFIVAENTSPEPVDASAWFAVDIPHAQLAMQPGPADSDPPVLPYRASGPRKSGGAAGTLSVLSLICAAVPMLGFVIRNGSVFLNGLLLSFAGAALGIGAVISSVKASSVSALAIVALVGNCLIAAYCIWLFSRY